jgi:hypothetical protein
MASSSSVGSGTGAARGSASKQRWLPVSPGPRSPDLRREQPIVSGLGILPVSSRSPTPEGPAVVVTGENQVPVRDRLVWQKPAPSRKTLWRHRKAAQCEAEAAVPRPISPEWDGLCFNYGKPGHRKIDCTNETLCLRCGDIGHHAVECKRPHSPSPTEEELRRDALAKLARREPAPPPMWLGRTTQRPNLLLAPPAFPSLRGGAGPVMASSSRQQEADVVDEPPLCIIRRTLGMQDLERRL